MPSMAQSNIYPMILCDWQLYCHPEPSIKLTSWTIRCSKSSQVCFAMHVVYALFLSERDSFVRTDAHSHIYRQWNIPLTCIIILITLIGVSFGKKTKTTKNTVGWSFYGDTVGSNCIRHEFTGAFSLSLTFLEGIRFAVSLCVFPHLHVKPSQTKQALIVHMHL